MDQRDIAQNISAVSNGVAGATCAIGISSTHYESEDCGEMLSGDIAEGTITKAEIAEVDMYSAQTSNPDHDNDTALIVVCRVM